ncbi:MAG: extracellular solute-binding protein [Clostridia bacterium]|nr:extracellular solute-binding protein [Clostridia bacterium]
MNKFLKVLSFLLALIICFVLSVGCGGDGGGGDGGTGKGIEEKIDATRTQFYIGNYNGGYGDKWLRALKTRFENFYKEEHFEEGKTGVQVLIDNKKEEYKSIDNLGGTIGTSKNSIYFTEGLDYDKLVDKGWLLDFSEILSSPLTEYGESKSIYDKMSEQQKNYYVVNGGKCYALPTYSAYFGTVYDIDLFEEYLLYFSANTNNGNEGFIVSLNDTKSNGPDGKANTYDDGLPATYDDFFKLCARMDDCGIMPMIWSGQYMSSYMRQYAAALMVDYEGETNARVDFDFSGNCNTLVSGFDSQGSPILTSEEITPSTGYKVFKQVGRYYSIDFVKRIIDGEYFHSLSTNITLSHTGAQEEFLFSKYESGTKPIAMLAEGIWWQSEAVDAFDAVVTGYGEEASQNNRRFGFMPYPKATQEKVGEGITLFDGLLSTCFINANVKNNALMKDLAFKFIRFAHTDESLKEFTKITNTPKSFDYEMSASDLDELTTFGKSVYEIKDNATVVYGYSSDSIGRKIPLTLLDGYLSTINGLPYADLAKTLKEHPEFTAKMYFEGIATYYSHDKWTVNYGGMFN